MKELIVFFIAVFCAAFIIIYKILGGNEE